MEKIKRTLGTLIWQKGEESLLFNGNSLSLVRTDDPEVLDFLDYCYKEKKVDILKTRFGSRYPDLFRILYDNGFIKYATEKEPTSPIFSSSRLQNIQPVTKMYLLVSQKCNFRCRYCYAGGDYGYSGLMDFSTAKNCIDYFLTEMNGKRQELTLFGGEPLLNRGVVEKSVKYASTKANEMGKNLDILVATNGSIIDENIIHVFREYNVGVQVSLDGFRKQQDYLRPFKSGETSFDVVFRNLEYLLENEVSVGVSTTITKYNLEHLESFYRTIKHLPLQSISLVLFSCLGQRRISPEGMAPDLKKYSETLINISRVYINDWAREVKPDLFPLKAILDSIKYGGRKRFCGAGTSSAFVDIEGNTYPCAYLVGNSKWKTGNINSKSLSHHVSSNISKTLSLRTVDDINQCKNCFWKYICGGGCAICTPIGDLIENEEYERKAWCTILDRIMPSLLWELSTMPD